MSGGPGEAGAVEVPVSEIVVTVSPEPGQAPPGPTSAPVIAQVETVSDYARLVAELTANGQTLWFRGARRANYRLEPSLYRHDTVTDGDALIELEWELLSEFRNRSPPFTNSIPSDNLELLFLMQHFGVPTRLLDWTENPMIALFFALENARQEAAGAEVDAAVWVLNPISLNTIATSHRENGGRVFGAYSDELAGYYPNAIGRKVSMRKPIALFGVHNSPRIVAQRGTFLLFGKDTAPADQQEELLATEGLLRKIEIRAVGKRGMFRDLFSMGVSDSVVYPDLDGLGREIRNRQGF